MLHFGRTFQHVPSIYVTKKATIQTLFLTLYRGFLHGRSGETRTRGLLLPKQARYQLRNTPEKYYHSILFFAAFVNPEVRNVTLPRKSTIKFYKNSERFLFILKQYK